MNQSFWTTIQPLLAQGARDLLRTIGTYLLARGIIQNDAGVTAFIGAGMTLAGIAWGWWTTSGYIIANNLLKKLTAKNTAAAAVTTAQALPTGAAVTKALAIFAVLLASLIFALPAMAQTTPAKRAPAAEAKPSNCLPLDVRPECQNGLFTPGTPGGTVTLTGNVSKDAQALWAKIVALSNADLSYASALAASANTNASKVRKQCFDAILALNQQANGASLKNADGSPMTKPDPPTVFTDVEQLAEVIDNLSPQGPLFTSCAGAAQLAKTSTLQFISAVVTGVAGITAIAPIIP